MNAFTRRAGQRLGLLRPTRRWLQVRLRTLLLAITLLSLWLGVQANRARTQREAVATILEQGGQVYYRHQRNAKGSKDGAAPPHGPAWLRRWLGDEYFQTPCEVHIASCLDTDACVAAAARLAVLEELTIDSMAIEDRDSGGYYQGWSDKPCRVHGNPLTDQGMESIARLTRLTRLTIGGAAITDEGLRHLAHLPRLQKLLIVRTPITGSGLSHLACLDRLQELDLRGTRLNNRGLETLSGVTQLRVLGLDRSWISDDGLRHLSGLTTLEYLGLGENDISDAGLKYLAGLTNLRSLGLRDTRITDDGLAYFKRMAALEGLDLNITSVGDDGLSALLGLHRIKSLQLYSTRVTDAAFERLRAFPNLKYVVIADPGETDEQIAFAQRFVRFGSPIARTPVTDSAIRRLQRALPKLQVRH